MSQVVVFNTTQMELNLILNQGMPQPIAEASPPQWTPSSVTFPRGNGGFDTQNQLVVSSSAGPNSQLYSIDTSAFQPQSDLQLYLFSSHAVLAAGSTEQVVTAQSIGGGNVTMEDSGPPATAPKY